jgi:hypothetical protein
VDEPGVVELEVAAAAPEPDVDVGDALATALAPFASPPSS